MPLTLDFSNAEAQRLRITQEQQKHIEELYKQASKHIGELAEQAPRVPSDIIRQQYLRDLQQQINDALRGIQRDLGSTIHYHSQQVATETVKDAKEFLREVGLPIGGAYSNVPIEIVQAVASGQLYTGNWTLSRALWLNTMETQKDVQYIVAQGILQNKSAYDIAKDLEKYVDPSARKDWEWSKVYPGTRKVVDYNAQRLARTMVSHAYQQAFVRTTIKNPFITKYQWQAAATERTCEICMERDGQLFDKDALPLDHPNGMCTYLAVIEDSMEDIADRLADWAHGETDPELDKWAEDLYGKGWGKKKETVKPKANTKATKETTRVSDSVAGMTKISEMNKAVNSSGWFTNKIYLQGCDTETAKHVVSAYQRIFDRFPQLAGKFPAPNIGMTNANAYANCATSTTGQITLNKSKFGNWDSLMKAYASDVAKGFHPEGTTAESLITHEFGHAIDGWLARSGLVKTDTGYASSTMIEKAFDKSGMSTSTVGWKVSSYAKKNDRECFAECFAQGMYSKDPCSLTNELMKDLDKLLGGK